MNKKKNKPADKLDIIESQIRLYQYCNDMTKKIHEMETNVTNMSFQMHILRKENFEIKHLMHGLSSHLQSLKDVKRIQEDDNGWDDENYNRQPLIIDEKKSLPLHDDIMMSCEVCGLNHHMNIKTCPKCGFNRIKKVE